MKHPTVGQARDTDRGLGPAHGRKPLSHARKPIPMLYVAPARLWPGCEEPAGRGGQFAAEAMRKVGWSAGSGSCSKLAFTPGALP